MTTIAIVVAAGRGTRFGGDRPKQYAPLGELTVLRRTLDALLAAPGIDSIRCVIHPDDDAAYRSATEGLTLLPAVPGGDTRQDSVRLGLESLFGAAPERVLIHDAARPFVTSAMIAGLLSALDQSDGAIPVLPVVDTLKRIERGSITGTVDRDGLGRAQTPQAFRFDAILAAHRTATGAAMTDDAAVAEAAGFRVAAVPGHEDTFKITTMADLARAERMLGNTYSGSEEIRCGSGFDVHAFGDGDRVVLCGVELPHDRGLLGHSDADVGLHAITDALLGAIADGDIGQHFPPSDPRWQGAPSDRFLAEARNRILARGGRIIHVDVTLVCERPKIGPHREAMRTRVAEILHIPETRVSVKATTTERLGFTGRGEGIAAQASATVALPGIQDP